MNIKERVVLKGGFQWNINTINLSVLTLDTCIQTYVKPFREMKLNKVKNARTNIHFWNPVTFKDMWKTTVLQAHPITTIIF
jgi:hypothetical protein